jgi:hypothetical protein
MTPMSLETPSQTHPEVCFTNFLGVSQYNHVDNQDKPSHIATSPSFHTLLGICWFSHVMKLSSLLQRQGPYLS